MFDISFEIKYINNKNTPPNSTIYFQNSIP